MLFSSRSLTSAGNPVPQDSQGFELSPRYKSSAIPKVSCLRARSRACDEERAQLIRIVVRRIGRVRWWVGVGRWWWSAISCWRSIRRRYLRCGRVLGRVLVSHGSKERWQRCFDVRAATGPTECTRRQLNLILCAQVCTRHQVPGYARSPRPQPRAFKTRNLTMADCNFAICKLQGGDDELKP